MHQITTKKLTGIMKTLKILLLLTALTAITFSCKKDRANFQSTGTITGPDYRECACCGGWFIDIADTTYNFDNLPASSNIDLATATFPIMVKLDWSRGRNCGGIQYIDISGIEKE
jgi:hypothetical protein